MQADRDGDKFLDRNLCHMSWLLSVNQEALLVLRMGSSN